MTVGMGWYPANPGNGLDRVFYSLHVNAQSAGIHPRAVVVSSAQSKADGVSVIDERGSLPRRLSQLRRVARIQSAGCDLVASHFALYAMPMMGAIRDLPFVVHFHGPWSAESSVEGESRFVVAAKRRVEEYVYRRADRVIVLSSAFRDVVAGFGVPRDRIDIIPGGVDLERFGNAPEVGEARERLGWDRDKPTLLAVRRLVRRVGLENLIDALSLIRQNHPDVVLKVAGRGPLEAELRARVASRGLDNAVEFLGFLPEELLPVAYAAADASVVPTSALEGFGLIAAESLAAGAPAFVTPIGGLPEVVAPLDEHLVFEGAEPGQMADRLDAWLSGRIVLPDRSACAAFAQSNYSWKRVAKMTRASYERVLADS